MPASSAEERGQQLFALPINQIPSLARDFGRHKCVMLGACAEVVLGAYRIYAMHVEGYASSTGDVRPSADDVKWFEARQQKVGML